MKWINNDGGRATAGYKGNTGDCVTRAIAIASGRPYQEIYDLINSEALRERPGARKPRRNGKSASRSTARTGVAKGTTKRVLDAIGGFEWVPTMTIGSGCKVHLVDGELPNGILIVSLSKHLTTVIDGVIHDTFDPQREMFVISPDHGQELKPGQWRNENGICSVQRRCVYGYWKRVK